MSFDRDALIERCTTHQRVARIVVAQVRGSAPREVGAAMMVWDTGQSGTIGGGALEFEAAIAAREMLASGQDRVTRHALGPDLGQCCGGHVTLLTEVYDLTRAQSAPADVVTRGKGPQPLSVRRILARSRDRGASPEAVYVEGWMVEPVVTPYRDIWIWGAGHVGRVLVNTLSALPGIALTWIDTDAARFPAEVPTGVRAVVAADPATLVPFAPPPADHVIVTYSHAIDLSLCHALLLHGFGFAGLIGSKTKWVRFCSRLSQSGHSAEDIARITCPIGSPEFGKHPQAIAIGVAAQLLKPDLRAHARSHQKDSA